MACAESTARSEEPAIRPGLRTWQLFALIATASMAITAATNRVLFTEELYASIAAAAGGSAADAANIVEEARRWEALAYALSPVTLFLRVLVAALLVQLALLLMASPRPLSGLLRGALWAHCAVLLGSAAQAAWIAFLPPSAVTAATLEAPPGTLASLVPLTTSASSAWGLLFRQVTVFDLAWVTLFATAIEDRDTVPAGRAFIAVAGAWLMVVAVRWVSLVFLSRLV